MLEMTGGTLALGLGAHSIGWMIASVLYPLFVICMIVDAFQREDREYPGHESNRKLIWLLLMVLVHPVTVAYYFMVYRKVRRGSAPASALAEPTS